MEFSAQVLDVNPKRGNPPTRSGAEIQTTKTRIRTENQVIQSASQMDPHMILTDPRTFAVRSQKRHQSRQYSYSSPPCVSNSIRSLGD